MKDIDTLFQAITAHATRAAEKLRQHGLVARTLTVFFHTNRHRSDRPHYAVSRSTCLPPCPLTRSNWLLLPNGVPKLLGPREITRHAASPKQGLYWTICYHWKIGQGRSSMCRKDRQH
nr:hypothetical protein [Loktanella sp. PT4BL]